MAVTIRSEKISDYYQIAEVNALAFSRDTFIGEISLVDYQRHGKNFDPELSLVAEVDGQVVGHGIFYPHLFNVGGESLKGVSLAPLAVHPDYQKQGIGTLIMEEGHRRAKAKGYVFAFLTGHPSYYPRFGYITNMFGHSILKFELKDISLSGKKIEVRRVHATDLEFLTSLWREWFYDVDMALYPGESILDWLNFSENIASVIITCDGEVQGYLRYSITEPANVKLFLAKDEKATQIMLEYLRKKCEVAKQEQIWLPLHPNSEAVKERISIPYQVNLKAWAAGMIKILDESSQPIVTYCNDVASGVREPGLMIFPPSFECA